jgi:hypothetical protein
VEREPGDCFEKEGRVMRKVSEFELVFNPCPLDRFDRRILLGGSLRVLVWRYRTGRPILRADLIRVTSLADDWEEQNNRTEAA